MKYYYAKMIIAFTLWREKKQMKWKKILYQSDDRYQDRLDSSAIFRLSSVIIIMFIVLYWM